MTFDNDRSKILNAYNNYGNFDPFHYIHLKDNVLVVAYTNNAS